MPSALAEFAGRLNTVVTLESPSETGGDAAVTWTTIAAVWAEKRGLGGSELSGLEAEANYQFRLRYRADVTPRWRLGLGVSNWCLQSQALATSPWFNNNGAAMTVTNNAAAAPDGTMTATKLLPGAVNGQFIVEQVTPITIGEYTALSGYFKANGYTGVTLKVDGVTGNFTAAFDLLTGTVTQLADFGTGYNIKGASIVALPNGWYRCSVWGATATDATLEPTIVTYANGAGAIAQAAWTADGVSSILAWGVQFERTGRALLPAAGSYVPTTSSPAFVGRRFNITSIADPDGSTRELVILAREIA